MAPLVWAPYQPQAPKKPPYEIIVVATAMVQSLVAAWESVWQKFGRASYGRAGGDCVHSRNAKQRAKHLSSDRYRSATAGKLQKGKARKLAWLADETH